MLPVVIHQPFQISIITELVCFRSWVADETVSHGKAGIVVSSTRPQAVKKCAPPTHPTHN